MLVTDCAGHFDAETLGVLPHLVCELSALDALGEPWVVVDCLSDSCLSSNTDTLDNQCFNSFTRRIHRRREAGRATADHDQIVERLGSLRVDSQLRSQLSIAWFNQNRTILKKNDCRDDLLTIVGVLDVLASGLVLTNVHPVIENTLFSQKLLGSGVIKAPRRTVYCDLGFHYRDNSAVEK